MLVVVLTVGFCLLSRPTRLLFFTVLGVMSAFELENVLKNAGMPVDKYYLSAYIVLDAVLCYLSVSPVYMAALLALFVFGAFFRYILAPERTEPAYITATCFTLVWPYGFFALILYIAAGDSWLPVLALSVLSTWACDSMALLGGKAIGGKKLSPVVSPHKTWTGTITGAVSAAVAGYLIYLLLRGHCAISPMTCVVTAFVASSFGQVGDLAASAVKRMCGVKDYSNLIPEHGGIMDRMDSMLFAIPAGGLCLYVLGFFGRL